MALAAVTIGMLAVGHALWGVAAMMVVWGTLNSAIPVAWSTWLSKGIRDEPESGGGLMVGTIQLAIMLGAGFGGLLLDHLSIAAPFIGSAVLLTIASVAVGGAHPQLKRTDFPLSLVMRDTPSALNCSGASQHIKKK
jgi:predicted MFS family arabinose efflux permease